MRSLEVVVTFGAAVAFATSIAGAAQLPKLPGPGSLKAPAVNNDYRGGIEFVWNVNGPNGWSKETWIAHVNAFGVQCDGAFEELSQGQLTHTPLIGPGLFHITFDPARGQYTFEVACPDSSHPTQSSWTDTNSSYKKPGKEGDALNGSWSEPSDEDPANGISGHKTMTWNLCYKCEPPKQ